MEQLITREVLISAKRKAARHSYQDIIIVENPTAYPPKYYTINELLLNQYASAMIDEVVHNTSDQKIDKKVKYPLPIIFAYLQINQDHLSYHASLRVLLNNLDKKNIEHPYILNYNIAKLLSSCNNHKKSLFHYQNLLKEKPFFVFGLYDMCRLLAEQFDRKQEAMGILRRHMRGTLQQNVYIQSLYISYLPQPNSKDHSTEKQKQKQQHKAMISNTFHGLKMGILSYYNLALYLFKMGDYPKSLEMFKQIRSTYDGSSSRLLKFEDEDEEEEGNKASPKDSKLYLLVQVNIARSYEALATTTTINQNNSASIFKQKALNTYIKIDKALKCEQNNPIKQKIVELQSQLQNRNIVNIPHQIPTQKIIYHQSKTAQPSQRRKCVNKNPIKEGQNVGKENVSLGKLGSFNQQYAKKRQYNDKKLKYLLMKEKEISNFFKNIVVQKEKQGDKFQIKLRSQQFEMLHQADLVKKAKKELKQSEIQAFQSEFQQKRKLFELRCDNSEIEKTLQTILENLSNSCKTDLPQLKSNTHFKNTTPLKTDQNKFETFHTIKEESDNQSNGKFLNSKGVRVYEKSIVSDRSRNFRIKKQSQDKNQLPSTNANANNNLQNTAGSTFQLTGFNRTSMGNFGIPKSNKVIIPTTAEQFHNDSQFQTRHKRKGFSIEFEKSIQEGQKLQSDQKHKEAYEAYVAMYKHFKLQNEKQEILLKIASMFEKEQKYVEAEKTYLKCSKYNNAQAFTKMGALLLRLGRVKSGVENLQKANCIKRFDLDIQNKLVYGYSLKQQTIDKGLALANAILKKQPQSLETLVMIVNILQKQGKLKEAIELALEIDKFKQTEYMKHYLGLLYLQDSNIAQAFNCFKDALKVKPNHLPSLIQIATILSDLKPKQAIAILNKVLQVEPQSRLALARLGKIYEAVEKDFENAMRVYRIALDTQQNYESYMKIADCHVKRESYLEALVNYKEAANMKKTHEVYSKMASMYNKKNQLLKAVENYNLALTLLPKQHSFSAIRRAYLYDLSKICIQMGHFDQAIVAIEDILENEETEEMLKMLAQSYFGKGDYSSALEHYEKANSLANGRSTEILESIAVCFDKKEEYLASKAIYEKILELEPENGRAMNNLANILLIIGETNEAFYIFQNMLQKTPLNLEKRLKVSDIYATIGDWSKVEYHLMIAFRQKENDIRVLERLVQLFKEKRENKLMNKYEKRLAFLKLTGSTGNRGPKN